MKLIAVIPARVNSKRLPNKNFRQFFGRPIIEWIIDEVKKSELFDKIIVSTDEADIFYHNGSIYNSIKPKNWNNQNVNTFIRKNPTYEQTVDEVCLEVLQEYPDYDYMACIYPTAYAVTWQELCKSFSEMLNKNYSRSYSCNTLNIKHGSFLDNGGFYWCKTKDFLKNELLMPIISSDLWRITPFYNLPMVDINTIQDFAEAKLHALSLPCGRYK